MIAILKAHHFYRHLGYVRLISEANVLEVSAWLDYKGDKRYLGYNGGEGYWVSKGC